MHPLAFQRLWKLAGGRVPHLDKNEYSALLEISGELCQPQGVQYWGVVGQQVRYRGHNLLHCYNFGNASITYPWRARLVNFGHEVPARITRAGTIKNRERGTSMLDKVMDPYLVFCMEADAAVTEHLEAGMLLAAGPASQCSEFEIAVPKGTEPPAESGILYYYMMRRLPFKAEAESHWVAQGGVCGMNCFRIKLQHPVVMEAGWPVLMLEKDRWFWGLVYR